MTMARKPRPWSTAIGAGMLACASLGSADDAHAQVGDNRDALPGLVHVPVAGRIERTGPAVALSAGYGYIEPLLGGGDHHDRLMGTVAASVRPAPWLAFALRFDGRYDHDFVPGNGGAGSSTGYVGDPRAFARVGADLPDGFRIGGQFGLWLPGDQAPSLVLRAATLDLTAMVAYAREGSPWVIAAHGGGRWDNSAASVQTPARLTESERLGLGVSSASGILSGVGFSFRAMPRLELIGDLSADWLVGGSALESPIVAALGGRWDANPRRTASLLFSAEASPSARPSLAAGQPLVDVEPRVSAIFGLVLRTDATDASQSVAEARPAEEHVVATPPTTAAVKGAVTAPSGAPLFHAMVHLTPPSGDERTAQAEADGGFEFDDVPLGSGALEVEAKGYTSVKRAISVDPKVADLAIVLEPAIPPAQIRGLVRDFAGSPVAATVVIQPLGTTAAVGADGSFAMDVKPGAYDVSITAKGYAPQRRKVVVEPQGVTLLNVDLRSAR